ncbi:primosomal protein N' [Lacticigenium naphthae]|uniref:primosomal protein N' n=1 Tax=Lacticigenium naphthae TaxID=515351 RepID=UPI00040DCD1A|nr:primosomal protein N' [Lacticigenium naphthae]
MTQIAKIIVDVPTMQTNRPFDYKVPLKFEDAVKKGMRVIVPFGKGTRKVQGFVIDLTDYSEFDGNLKEIDDLMDVDEVLSEELIQLGTDMAYKTFSFQISCYQTMLPSVLRASYQKTVRIIDEIEEELLFSLFKGKHEIPWEIVVEQDKVSEIMKLKKLDKIEIIYNVSDRSTTKKKTIIYPQLKYEEYEEIKIGLTAQATKQKLLLDILQSLKAEGIDKNGLVKEKKISAATVREAEKRGWLLQKKEEIYRDPFENSTFLKTNPLPLNEEQLSAYEDIMKSIEQREKTVFLLKGITGSGKTEIYLQSIAEVLKDNKSALMLVPEIALTPQMVNQFKSRFGEEVAVLHSGLSNGEKYDEWRKIYREEAKVVVGARSSIFAPLKNIGLIIIDEEHENSYKQDENPRYHARDIAVWRGNHHNCPVILGSATPSLESRARASKNVYKLIELKKRANKKPLPEVTLVDMREEVKKGNRSSFSELLKKEIKNRIDRNEQCVLLLNRRGYSSFVMCRECGFVLPCPNCDISLTLHMDTKTMKCHYCGHEENIPNRCPQCQSASIRYYGTGTQKIEEELQALIPEAKIIRMDVDTTRKKGAHEKLLKKFGSKKANILLGTQMIAKGLDFPDVTLVGVLNADTALSLPDFRSSEKTFQLLTQVSGRSGRAELEGKVIVQSFNPEHYSIQLAQTHRYDLFYKKEMNLRRSSQYPPYYFILRVSVSHENELKAAKKMNEIIEFIRPAISNQAIVLGPTPKSIARTKNKYHYQVLIKYKHEPALYEKLHELLLLTQKDLQKGWSIGIDPEPTNFI